MTTTQPEWKVTSIDHLRQIGSEKGLAGARLDHYARFFWARFDPLNRIQTFDYARERAQRFTRNDEDLKTIMDGNSLRIFEETRTP